MPKRKTKNRGGRPAKDPALRVSKLYGIRFNPKDRRRIEAATKLDDTWTARIRELILREVARTLGDAVPKPKPRKKRATSSRR